MNLLRNVRLAQDTLPRTVIYEIVRDDLVVHEGVHHLHLDNILWFQEIEYVHDGKGAYHLA